METQDTIRAIDALIVSAESKIDDVTKARILKAALPYLKEAVILLCHETRTPKSEDH
jgi:hypothetical protein